MEKVQVEAGMENTTAYRLLYVHTGMRPWKDKSAQYSSNIHSIQVA
jgi:hypothetical protein